MGISGAISPEPSASRSDDRWSISGRECRSGRAWKGSRQAPIQCKEGFTAREGATDVQLELAGTSQNPGGNLDQFLDDRFHAAALGGMAVADDALSEDPEQPEHVVSQHAQAQHEGVGLERAARHPL